MTGTIPAVDEKKTWTQDELAAEALRRFGENPENWAFICPRCGDVAVAQDFRDANSDPNRIGRECIGRHRGALRGLANTTGKGQADRGCDWAAYGLFRGPWSIQIDDRTIYSFRLAPAPVLESITEEIACPASAV